jgi:hypothetical protein
MTDPRDYAQPRHREVEVSGSQPLTDIEYTRQAVAYIKDCAAKVAEDRAWVDKTYQEIAGALGDGLFEPRSPTSAPPVDPIVAGLLDHLPKPGAVWPRSQRQLFVKLLEGSFELIYKDDTPAVVPAKQEPA